MDYFLQTHVQTLPSYIRDTSYFLDKIQHIKWEDNLLLIVMDIESLYTSIDHQTSLTAVKHYLDTRPLTFHNHNMMLLEMIKWCLLNNIFMFDNILYCQKRGVAMGACFFPSYARLHIGW